MILTTTNGVPDGRVGQVLGLLAGDAICSGNVFRDAFASIRNFFGGTSKSYESTLNETRRRAIGDLQSKAEACGADAVIGVSLDTEFIEIKYGGGLIMIVVTGTAVKLEPVDPDQPPQTAGEPA